MLFQQKQSFPCHLSSCNWHQCQCLQILEDEIVEFDDKQHTTLKVQFLSQKLLAFALNALDQFLDKNVDFWNSVRASKTQTGNWCDASFSYLIWVQIPFSDTSSVVRDLLRSRCLLWKPFWSLIPLLISEEATVEFSESWITCCCFFFRSPS